MKNIFLPFIAYSYNAFEMYGKGRVMEKVSVNHISQYCRWLSDTQCIQTIKISAAGCVFFV